MCGALLLVVALVLWISRDGRTPTRDGGGGPGPAQPGELVLGGPAPARPALPADLSWLTPDGAVEIAGVVLRDGALVAGAQVTLQPPQEGPAESIRTETDEDGRFTFGLQPVGGFGLSAVTPEASAFVRLDLRSLASRARAGSLEIELVSCEETERIEIVDRASRPVAGASIVRTLPIGYGSARRVEATADENGVATICRSSHEPAFLAVEADGYASVGLPFFTTPPRVVLPRAATIHGFVRSEGRAAAGALVQVFSSSSFPREPFVIRTLSAADGSYELRGLVPDCFTLSALRGETGAEGQRVCVAPGATERVELSLERCPVTVNGTVHRPDGAPLPDARVGVGWAETYTADDGAFRLPCAMPGELWVQGMKVSSPADPLPEGRHDAMKVTVGRTVPVTVSVLRGGAPVRGALVTTTGSPWSGETPPAAELHLRTDADGIAELELPEGVHEVFAHEPPMSRSSAVEVSVSDRAEPERIHLVLAPLARLTGTLVDRSGRPATGISVLLDPDRLGGSLFDQVSRGGHDVTDSQGRFVFEQVPHGAYSLTLGHDHLHFASGFGDEPVSVPSSGELHLRLEENLVLRKTPVHVVDGDGDAVAGAYVDCRDVVAFADDRGTAVCEHTHGRVLIFGRSADGSLTGHARTPAEEGSVTLVVTEEE